MTVNTDTKSAPRAFLCVEDRPPAPMTVGRLIDIRVWQRKRMSRYAAPAKDNVFNATDEALARRLQQLQLPEPPPAFRERSRQAYGQWLQTRSGRQRWRG